ncbi:SRPBCC domain-containing protein [Candidatus Binatus sp.]|uniref:SRPBCC domain-containing protein n=1 Tax=Candidatus Binatus sp. TaxID=2811406 RepID=UPI003C7198FF
MTLDPEVNVGDRALTITRIFDAPRPLVFFAWSKPKYLMRWFAPNNFTVPECEMDFRDGGFFRVCMRGFGKDHRMNGVFREIVKNERIVWAGLLDNDTNEVVTTATFTVMRGSKTRLTVHQTYSIETDSTRGAPQGWTEALDHLAEFLADA